MLCSRCKKRQAVVFITTMNGNEKKNEGLCLICAKKAGISQIDDYMKQMGITDEDLEEFAESFPPEGDSFEPGGSGTMPEFFSNLMNKFGGGPQKPREQADNPDTKTKQGGRQKNELRLPTAPT